MDFSKVEAQIPLPRIEEVRLKSTKITFTLSALSSGKMPYNSSSIWRGMWGRELKRKTCMYTNLECKNCSNMLHCAYGSIFEPTSEVFADFLSDNRKFISPPIVIEAPFFEEEEWNKGETAELTIIFFGDSVKFLYHFVESLIEIGERYGVGSNRIIFQIDKVEQILKNGRKNLLDHSQSRELGVYREELIWKESEQPVTSLMISIDSPLRIQKQGTILTRLDLNEFLLNCQRRMEYLTGLYGNRITIQKDCLLEQASFYTVKHNNVMWKDWERFSSKQKKAMNLGGLMGSFQLHGDLTSILPMLMLASYAHIGKQTVFGLGKFTVYQAIE